MRALRDAGYRTSVFGKIHLHPHAGDLREKEHLLHGYGLDDYRADFEERFSRRPWMVRPSTRHREDAISEVESEVMILTDDWKRVGNDASEPYLLFSRTDDPDEVDNLVLDPTTAEVRAELSQRIRARVLESQIQIGSGGLARSAAGRS